VGEQSIKEAVETSQDSNFMDGISHLRVGLSEVDSNTILGESGKLKVFTYTLSATRFSSRRIK
jgi:hypothetical protein